MVPFPSHLHNPSREAQATKAQELMAEYSKHAPSMYSAMLANLETFKVEEDWLINELATNHKKALVNLAPTLSWKIFNEKIDEQEKLIEKFDEEMSKQVSTFLEEKTLNGKEVKNEKAAIAVLKKAMKTAQNNVDNLNQLVAMLRESFTQLPDIATDLQLEGSQQEALTEIAKGIGEKEVRYVNWKGEEKTAEIKKIAENFKGLTKARPSSDLPSAPGINLIILNLGLELAETEMKKTQVKLGTLTARVRLFEEAYMAIGICKQLLKLAKANNYPPDQTPFHTIYAEWNSTIKTQGSGCSEGCLEMSHAAIGQHLLRLRQWTTSMVLIARTRANLKVSLSRLDHQDSIVQSRVNDEARQAVIRNGLAGLVAYHKAGWSDEDTANLLSTAQSVALGVIGVGVN